MLHFYTISLSPLTQYTGLWVAGIIMVYFFAYPFCILIAVACIILIIKSMYYKKYSSYLTYALCIAGGAWHYHTYVTQWKDHLNRVAHKPLTLTGIILNKTSSLNKQKTTQLIIHVKGSSQDLLANKSLAVYLTGNTDLFIPGHTVKLEHAIISFPADHFCTYLMKEGLAATLYISAKQISILSTDPQLRYFAYIIRWKLLQWAHSVLSPNTYIFFSSLFLGYKRAEPLEMHDSLFSCFKFWGIAHYIARSGLHLGILILLWQMIISLIPLSWQNRQYSLILLSTSYFLCSWSSISFLRAFTTFFVGRLFAISKRPSLFIHSLSVASMLMLLANPVILFFLDFQLSFGMTYALAWLQSVRDKHARTELLQNK